MKFENTTVFNFDGALRGMRNPLESWHKNDSYWDWENTPPQTFPKYVIGENDKQLAQKLIRAGSTHRKFMRQIFICVDITAPLYFFKEFDTYKVGTVGNSTSTMHKLASTPITLDCFEIDDYDELEDEYIDDVNNHKAKVEGFINWLEYLRGRYNQTKSKKIWKEIVRWLASGWLQKRTITMNYETVLSMIDQRKHHKLNEWSGIDDDTLDNFIKWARTLPYANELLFIDEE